MGCPRPNTPRSNPYDLGELDRDLRDRLYTLFHDAPARGLTLVSGYRDPGRQWDLRHERVPGRECDPSAKAVPATAVPATWNGSEWVGGSHHQHRGNGIGAADIGGRDLQWAIDNRARYGLGLTVRSENWHFEAHGTDARTGRPIPAPTVRILPYPGRTWDAPTPPAWSPPPFPGTIRKGSTPERVAQWRVLLAACGYKGFKVGVHAWSTTLGAATRRFQRNHGLVVDGIVGPKTWAIACQVLRKKRAKAKG